MNFYSEQKKIENPIVNEYFIENDGWILDKIEKAILKIQYRSFF